MSKQFSAILFLVASYSSALDYQPDKAYLLHNIVQEYAWGSKQALADFLGCPLNENKPMAELWMGAHPKAPSHLCINGKQVSLLSLLEQHASEILGGTVAKKFNNALPFLFKVLAADQPLSMQVHPTIAQAQIGFEKENALGIPLNAFNRNYKDANHKPELICALTPFWALNGFKPLKNMACTIASIDAPLLHALSYSFLTEPNTQNFKKLLHALFNLDQKKREALVTQIVAYTKKHLDQDPAFRWALVYDDLYPGDISVVLCLLLNIFCLQPGQALFVGAGQIHAYLQGMGIEIMANSDNVLRAGGTHKHVDAQELLRILNFDQKEISVITHLTGSSSEKIYEAPAQDFQLSVLQVDKENPSISKLDRSIEILLCTKGHATFVDLSDGECIELKRGASIMVPASLQQYTIKGDAVLYKATVKR